MNVPHNKYMQPGQNVRFALILTTDARCDQVILATVLDSRQNCRSDSLGVRSSLHWLHWRFEIHDITVRYGENLIQIWRRGLSVKAGRCQQLTSQFPLA